LPFLFSKLISLKVPPRSLNTVRLLRLLDFTPTIHERLNSTNHKRICYHCVSLITTKLLPEISAINYLCII